MKNYHFIEEYDNIRKQEEKLYETQEKEIYFYVKIVNPCVIPFLPKRFINLKEKSIKNLINSKNIVKGLEEIKNSEDNSYKWSPLIGIKRITNYRRKMDIHYLIKWKSSFRKM